ncbi:D-2-hydroxyacid dehydrogenase [Microbacterium sp. C5A9]|uniref:D-2-hydroxyacid dehydrogenase n=1 Tax=Microbacterium sp. C5A9 TaxID=2736663 RepID=UPI001F521F1F|nr:D-2-hydroxyacid dehydrogenase [Microbacterium sp. C5A9]MCI1017139.1 D-2-hydroxyacid dehydrogenase [Microbacterium sp. C5A9]
MTALRVFVPTPLPDDLCALIAELEPRIELIRDPGLLPPQLYQGDHLGDPAFRRSAAQQLRFEQLLDQAEALYGVPDQSPTQLHRTAAANPSLRWVHTTPAGGGAQVKDAALTDEQLARIAFTTSGGVHGGPLAEFAVLGVLAGAQNLARLLTDQHRREWGARRPVPQVDGSHVVVVGLGGIGRTVARKLHALGARVTGIHRRTVDAPGVAEIRPPSELGDALSTADAVVLALPGTDATRDMLSGAVLAQAKPGITVVNVGRGSTVDEPALIDALASGLVGFAALDVFAVEPLPETSPLWSMPNVLVSPHNAGTDIDEERRIAELFAANATRLIDGEPLMNRVDTVEFY